MTSGPIIIGSERSEAGLPAGMALLRQGASALDAVEAALRLCEDNLDDHYVGTGGLPNARGEVELDASIMVGSTRAFGAVGAVRNFPHPISIARAVLEQLPQHCLLVGEGAELFAQEQGFEPATLLTDEAWQLFREALRPSREAVEGEKTLAAPGDDVYRLAAIDLVNRFRPHEGPWGTINVLALDESGEMVVGVSTSGYPWKYPGRVGDSALPGAGNYCDLRYGGAACTGRGEMSMRVTGARLVVEGLARGDDPSEACRKMLADAGTLHDDFRAELRTLCLTPDGRHGAAAGQSGATYNVMTSSSTSVEVFERVVL
ncbi:MAG TPA: N(4)-(beta-N-acetylglucosaminyl)-L-asparaginase [Acidimicrobiales bacterium]|nr:N(4)-(beta-N-acetylglucosaminyl)-L-asparaginase [Acidimicrobiales bacterium]